MSSARAALVERMITAYAMERDLRDGMGLSLAIALEEAARIAEAFPARAHGNLSADPFEAADQAANECASAIRAIIKHD